MRVNARLDEERAGKLEYLRRKFGVNVSDVIKHAIDAYYALVRQEKPEAGCLLEKSGFIGCAEGADDLSVRYKEELRKSLGAKHGHR